MKLNLTPVIAAIAITLVIVMVINAPTVLISIAYAGLDNFLFSNKASSAIYNQGITSLATTIPGISVDQLPPEALITIKNIKNGGPFPFPNHDGTTLSNREEILPSKPLGYYKEYTVPTPGIHSRGAQRIITGQNGEMYYTPDHYNTFERIIIK
jgi:guanyl-specific ribonuclease Sa